MSLPLHLRGETHGGLQPGLYKLLQAREALELKVPLDRVLVDLRGVVGIHAEALVSVGAAGVVSDGRDVGRALPHLRSLSLDAALSPGDAFRLQPGGKINVLFRRGANANALCVTERCNSLCVMCSQPPRKTDDAWRVGELIDLLPLIDPDLNVLGLTGGEPTLLDDRLLDLLASAARILPATTFHVLTNGRRFVDRAFVRRFAALRGRVLWAVPLYADTAGTHDEVVGSEGAFAETMHALYNLAEAGHRIELRTVMHAMTLPRLKPLSEYIYRNLPFVEHVALMGLEPMGLARTNIDRLRYMPEELNASVLPAVRMLDQRGMRVSLYNVPLCSLSPALRPFARKSISDWKNEFAPACSGCQAMVDCTGFFRSADGGSRSRGRSWQEPPNDARLEAICNRGAGMVGARRCVDDGLVASERAHLRSGRNGRQPIRRHRSDLREAQLHRRSGHVRRTSESLEPPQPFEPL